jgi:hypothetical protein
MATQEYLDGRKKYARPQAMMWSTQPPQVLDGKYVPYGLEVNDNVDSVSDESLKDQFLILSDDNRESLGFSVERIESRKRMVNGQMRSYHIADKLNITTSWSMLPSRGFATYPNFNLTTGQPNPALTQQQMVTSDGGAGGVDMLTWYENHKGSFWVYLSYDKYTEFERDGNRYLRLAEYPQAIEMFISSFSYDVVKRGGHNHDLWNISLSLEEV